MWITVIGRGSFSVYRGPIWRGPNSYEISDEHAEECLAYKEDHPDSNHFIISAEKPTGLDEHGKPDWMLRPMDFAGYTPEEDATDLSSPDADYQPQDDDFPCQHCGSSFSAEPGLAQHIALKHANIHEQVEDEARAQLAAERQRKALAERLRVAPETELRPEERGSA